MNDLVALIDEGQNRTEPRAHKEDGGRMIVLRSDADGADVHLSSYELKMLNNALNEVCNGVRDLADDSEFHTRLGSERVVLQRLLAEIHRVA